MRIAIVGGALQGIEATHLAHKAGYESFVIDRKDTAPAMSLSDDHAVCDVVKDGAAAEALLSDCDMVMPACEEMDALVALDNMCHRLEKPFLFDIDAYRISCSKERSNELFQEVGVPIPKPWPECGFPMIVKPSSQSGSIGVSVADNEQQRLAGLKRVEELGDVPIQQEFVSGKSVSIETIGNGETARSYIVTEVVLDSNYDCKLVDCRPKILSPEQTEDLASYGVKVAEKMGLRGLMDVEAIRTKNGLRVLEIDARIPSQTPAAIEAATGINLLEELVCAFNGTSSGKVSTGGSSVYEHYKIANGNLYTVGEKEFGHVRDPSRYEGLFGADEVITDLGKNSVWYATVINSGKNPAEVLEKRKRFITSIMDQYDLDEYVDRSPEMI